MQINNANKLFIKTIYLSIKVKNLSMGLDRNKYS